MLTTLGTNCEKTSATLKAQLMARWLPLIFLMFAQGVQAQLGDNIREIVCEIVDITVDGEQWAEGPVLTGDWFVYRPGMPSPGTPPDATGAVPGGFGGAWFDPPPAPGAGWLPLAGEGSESTAMQSVIVVEDGDSDFKGWDSTGFPWTFGDWAVLRFAGGLRDEDGQSLDDHLEPPQDFIPFGWPTADCQLEFVNQLTEQSMILQGTLVVESGPGEDGYREISIPYDYDALVAAIRYANRVNDPGGYSIKFTGEEKEIIANSAYQGGPNGFPAITSNVKFTQPVTIRRPVSAVGVFRAFEVTGDGFLTIDMPLFERLKVIGFSSDIGGGGLLFSGNSKAYISGLRVEDTFSFTNGGGILASDFADVRIVNSEIKNCEAEFDGGGIYAGDFSFVQLSDLNRPFGESELGFTGVVIDGGTAGGYGGGAARGGNATLGVGGARFVGNRGEMGDGAIHYGGDAPENFVFMGISRTYFEGNEGANQVCDVGLRMMGSFTGAMIVQQNTFVGLCNNTRVDTSGVPAWLLSNTAVLGDIEEKFIGPPKTDAGFFANAVKAPQQQQLQASNDGRSKPREVCADSGGGNLISQGGNVVADASCNLTHPTDLENTDPMLADAASFEVPIPLAGSPVIDRGGVEPLEYAGQLVLPCGFVDGNGLGRPQDGDGDGIYACDSGAVEYPGPGAISAGHSAAFYNPSRNGEGQYVEILGNGLAVIYTFSYRPDGSGAAWFTSIAQVVGNSLVSHELVRPVGTSFGDDFDSSDIERLPMGGMSMVFNTCESANVPGNAVYTGSAELGFEPVVTNASRLSDIVGCGTLTPQQRAGFSGSFFDPERDGEGLVIQWLPDGNVLAIMFTYDLNENQMWITGIGTPDGDTVTMDVVYPTAFTSWGSGFDPDSVVLSDWGTFTLNWTGCNNLVFEYDSSITGYGSAIRNYTRLTQLDSTQCPAQ